MNRSRVVIGVGVAFSALFLVAANVVPGKVRNQLEAEVSGALEARGLTWASVEVHGRSVVLVGEPEGEQQRVEAIFAARAIPGVAGVRAEFGLARAGSVPQEVSADGEVPEGSLPVAEAAVAAADASADDSRSPSEVAVAPPQLAPAQDEEEITSPPDPGPKQEVRPEPEPSPSVSVVVAEAEPAVEAEANPVVRESCETRVTRAAHNRVFFFVSGETSLDEESRGLVGAIRTALSACREWTLTIVGYAGPDEGEAEWSLAEKRSRSVAALLIGAGIDESRIATVGGSYDPSTSLDASRVEIFASGG